MTRARSIKAAGAGLALFVAGTAQAQDAQQWLCVADAATGFSYDESTKKWGVAKFKTDEMKYVVRRPTAEEQKQFTKSSIAWVYAEVGKSRMSGACRKDFDEDEITCGGPVRFSFSRKTLRYQGVSDFGYVSPIDREGGDTPHIEIGRCSPI